MDTNKPKHAKHLKMIAITSNFQLIQDIVVIADKIHPSIAKCKP